MSLDWNVSKIVAREGEDWTWPVYEGPDSRADGLRHGERYLNRLINCAIWWSLMIDVGDWSEKNMDMIKERTKMVMVCGIHPICSSNGDRNFTDEEYDKLVGLTTNVTTTPETKWKTRMYDLVKREAGIR